MSDSTKRSKPANARFDPALGFILFGALARLIPHPPNVAPIAAMALFGGARLGARLAFVAPLVAMLLSDLILGLAFGMSSFNSITPFVYVAFAAIGLAGMWLRRWGRSGHVGWIAGATLGSSVWFFIVTNFGVWAAGSFYPRDPQGLIACYVAAIPFFRNTIVGDAFWAIMMFGGYALLRRWVQRPEGGRIGLS